MFKSNKSDTPATDRLAALKSELADVQAQRAKLVDRLGVAVLDEPDSIDAMRNADERLGRREAELIAASPVAQQRAAAEREAERIRGIEAEIERLERVEAERKRAYAKVTDALERLEAACVEYRAVEKPPMLGNIIDPEGQLRRMFLGDLRVAPTFMSMSPGAYLTTPLATTELRGTDAYFARCLEVATRKLRAQATVDEAS